MEHIRFSPDVVTTFLMQYVTFERSRAVWPVAGFLHPLEAITTRSAE
jgi:hypothetical protein